jgi:hypothetical protein
LFSPLPEQAFLRLPGATEPLFKVSPAFACLLKPPAAESSRPGKFQVEDWGEQHHHMTKKHYKPLMEQVRAAG